MSGAEAGAMRSATSGLLATLLALGFPGAGLGGPAGAGPAEPLATLTVESDPPGAEVFVDGHARGATPLTLAVLPAGDHRVSVVKAGYLENSRIVSLGRGTARSVRVRLTADPGRPRAAQVDPGAQPEETKKGGSKKLLLIGLGAAALGAGAFVLLGGNKAPEPGSVAVSPGYTGLMAVTTYTFTAQGASDPDGDPLTYSWAFGDGGSGNGASVTHVFDSAGTFQVTLTVSDGKKSATANGSVSVRDVNGTWVSVYQGTTRIWSLAQSRGQVSGTYASDRFPGVPGTVSGTLRDPRTIAVTAGLTGVTPFSFNGQFNDQVTSFTGQANGSGFVNETMVFNRQ